MTNISYPLHKVIAELFDQKVLLFDRHNENIILLDAFQKAMNSLCLYLQEHPIIRPRPNEVGNDIEEFVINYLRKHAISASRPSTRSGKGKANAYPNIFIPSKPTPIYLEVKSYAAANKNTSLRSFYLSPSQDPKICHDAHHLLIGFEVIRDGNEFRPVAWTLTDLYNLPCSIKTEYNSDNKSLYRPEFILDSNRLS